MAQVLPAVVLIPLLAAKLPLSYHAKREIGGYYQALALAQDGLSSYLYLTPQESYSSLHLHSILSAPFVAAGYLEGGRLISLFAAVAAASLVALIADRVSGSQAALLAPVFLWIQPMFIRHAYAFMPETLSIALTTGSLVSMFRFVDTGQDHWYTISVSLLFLGIVNHMWEATIALPLVVVLIHRREWIHAAGIGGVAIFGVVMTWSIGSLQPRGPSTLTTHGLHAVGVDILASPEWWLGHSGESLFAQTLAPTLLLGVVACIAWAGKAVRARDEESIIMSAWLASGLAIPILLAGGYRFHNYYLWALLAPLAVSVAIGLTEAIDYLRTDHEFAAEVAFRGLAAVFICSALIYGGVVEKTDGPSIEWDDGEVAKAGAALDDQGVTDPAQVGFVGWPENAYGRILTGRVLMYSGILIRDSDRTFPRMDGIEFAENETHIENSTICVTPASGHQVRVTRC